MLGPLARDVSPLDLADGSKQNLVDLAYSAIKQAILDNVYPPGYQAAEIAIAKRLGMSRTPVHEAVSRLQEEGLVRILPRRGIIVTGLSSEDVNDIYDVIIALEGVAAEKIADFDDARRQAIASALKQATERMETAIAEASLKDWAAADEEFHAVLLASCGNRRLQRMAATVLDQLHRARLFTLRLRDLPVDSAGEHQRIIDAIVAGDVSEANRAARDHRRHARQQILPLISRLDLHNI